MKIETEIFVHTYVQVYEIEIPIKKNKNQGTYNRNQFYLLKLSNCNNTLILVYSYIVDLG